MDNNGNKQWDNTRGYKRKWIIMVIEWITMRRNNLNGISLEVNKELIIGET